jgi:hypothetical protein
MTNSGLRRGAAALMFALVLPGVPQSQAATAALPAHENGDIARVIKTVTAVATDLGLEVELSRAGDGMVALRAGQDSAPLLGIKDAPAFVVYRFVQTPGGLQFTWGYIVGGLHLLSPPKRALPEAPRMAHDAVLTRAKKDGLKLKESKGFPPPDFVTFIQGLARATETPAGKPE